MKELKVDAKRKAESLANTTASLDAAAAEVRVVGKERQQLKLEWTEMFSAHDSLVSRINALEHQLAESHSAVQVRPSRRVIQPAWKRPAQSVIG